MSRIYHKKSVFATEDTENTEERKEETRKRPVAQDFIVSSFQKETFSVPSVAKFLI